MGFFYIFEPGSLLCLCWLFYLPGYQGCLPACDRYFLAGFKAMGLKYSSMNDAFLERLLTFCEDNLTELKEEQNKIVGFGGFHYPLMKLVDMYFWQVGYEMDTSKIG